jgi:hypothetical protein
LLVYSNKLGDGWEYVVVAVVVQKLRKTRRRVHRIAWQSQLAGVGGARGWLRSVIVIMHIY